MSKIYLVNYSDEFGELSGTERAFSTLEKAVAYRDECFKQQEAIELDHDYYYWSVVEVDFE